MTMTCKQKTIYATDIGDLDAQVNELMAKGWYASYGMVVAIDATGTTHMYQQMGTTVQLDGQDTEN